LFQNCGELNSALPVAVVLLRCTTGDPNKNEHNIYERELSFDRAEDFDFDSAVFMTEIRKEETRRVAVGYLDKRLHLLCYIPTLDGIRAISFRKTNKREAKLYGKPQNID
jgi:uncharacterized DUF497 family protein